MKNSTFVAKTTNIADFEYIGRVTCNSLIIFNAVLQKKRHVIPEYEMDLVNVCFLTNTHA